MFKSLLTGLLLTIGTAIITSILTYHFTNKTKKTEAILKFREEKYANLLVLLEGFVGETASADTKRDFFKEQHKSWLYCSDEVTKAINHMLGLVANAKGKNPDPTEGQLAIGTIVMKMRKDLLGKTSLEPHDFKYIDVIDPSINKRHLSR